MSKHKNPKQHVRTTKPLSKHSSKKTSEVAANKQATKDLAQTKFSHAITDTVVPEFGTPMIMK